MAAPVNTSQSTSPRNYSPPGSIKISTIELASSQVEEKLNLLPIVEAFNLYENLAYPFITGEFLIKDAQSLITTFPITGDETLHVVYQTPQQGYDRLIDITLRIVALHKLSVGVRVRHAVYLLRVISQEAMRDMTTVISWSYKSMPVSDMVKKIYDDYLKIEADIEIANTEGIRSIIVPNMAPTEAIKFLCRESKNPDPHQASDYIFYHNLSDKYYFKPVDELIKKTPIDYYYFTEKDVLVSSKSARSPQDQSQKPIEYMRVNSIVLESGFDIEKLYRSGGLDNSVKYINPVVSFFDETIFNYPDDHYDKAERTLGTPDHRTRNVGNFFSKDSTLIKNPGTSHMRYMYTNYGETGETAQSADQKVDFFSLRVGAIALMDNLVINISVPGDSDRRVGDTVSFNIPEFGATDDMIGLRHQFYSGRWLVTAVRHIYDIESGYQLQMQLIKNAYEPKDPDVIISKKPKKQGTNPTPTIPQIEV